MADFYSKIRNIEAQLNKLKSVGLTSSSSLGVAYQDVTMPVQIIATDIVSGVVYECGSSKRINIHLQPVNGQPEIVSNEIISPANLENRAVIKWRWLSNEAGYKYWLRIWIRGSHDDLDALNRGETIPPLNFVFRIKMTSQFSSKVVFEDVDIDEYN